MTKVISLAIGNWVTPGAGAEHDLLFNKLASEACLFNPILHLAPNIRCDLSRSEMLTNYSHYVQQKLNLSSSFRSDIIDSNH